MSNPVPFSLPSRSCLERFSALVGKEHALQNPDQIQPFLTEQRGRFTGKTAMVLCPGTVEEVSAIMALAQETETPIVPQGGNTGLVGGQIPSVQGNELVLSLHRLNRILEIHPVNETLTVEAGCTVQQVQEAASSVQSLFPLRLGSGGKSQIGGNISTNAGGINALSYGVMRRLTLGLQVVLPDGQIWDGLRALHKDNSGYDLKQLFIGSEGTLGIITAAVVKIASLPSDRETACVAVPDPESALELLCQSRQHFGQALTAFELLSLEAVQFGLRHTAEATFPLALDSPWYVLMDLTSTPYIEKTYLHQRVQAFLSGLTPSRIAQARIAQAAFLASTASQAKGIWILRTGLSRAQKQEGASIKHDVALPVHKIPEFLRDASLLVERLAPAARPVPFGHLGDGNLHYNISQPQGADSSAFLAQANQISQEIHSLVLHHGGTISAEHGIGQLKRDLLRTIKSPTELHLMHKLKNLLDPKNLLNPGKILPSNPR